MVSVIRSAVNSLASLGFIKFLSENDIRIIGVDVTEQGLGKIISPTYYKVPFASQEQETINVYTKILEKEKAQWIISGPENEINLLARHEAHFEKLGCKVFHSPIETLDVITNKLALYDAAHAYLPNPKSLTVEEAKARITTLSNIFDKQVIIKPIFGRGSKGVKLILVEELVKLLEQDQVSKDCIIQQCKKGKEYSVDTLHNEQGELLNAVVRERVATDSGISVITTTVRVQKIFDHIETLSNTLKFKGLSCIQFIEDDGEYFLTDINPRFGGGAVVSLKASVSFADNLIKVLTGQVVDISNPFDYKEMTMYRSYTEYYV